MHTYSYIYIYPYTLDLSFLPPSPSPAFGTLIYHSTGLTNCTPMYIYIYLYLCMCIHMYINIYIYIHIQSYIYKYTYIYLANLITIFLPNGIYEIAYLNVIKNCSIRIVVERWSYFSYKLLSILFLAVEIKISKK
jgi:hypothetical protein